MGPSVACNACAALAPNDQAVSACLQVNQQPHNSLCGLLNCCANVIPLASYWVDGRCWTFAAPRQVLRLQRQLTEAHGGDSDAIRRAYMALVQHVTALQQEAQVCRSS